MQGIYFPFSYISKPVLENYLTLFRRVIVYLPSSRSIEPEMAEFSATNRLDFRIPIKTDEDKLNSLFLDYLSWAELHEKTGISSFKTQSNSPPLVDGTWTAQIKSDIRNYSTNQAVAEPDPDFNARLFLKIAEKHDRHHHEMHQRIQSIRHMEQNLFRELHGGESDSGTTRYGDNHLVLNDIGASMIQERMSAWCRIMQKDTELPSWIFITNSLSVWNYVMDSSPQAQVIGHRIPAAMDANNHGKVNENLSKFLDMIQTEKWPPADWRPDAFIHQKTPNDIISLTIAVIPNQTPADYFARFIPYRQSDIPQHPHQSIFRNTVLGLLG